MNLLSYINPCSTGYKDAFHKYEELNPAQKALTIFLTVIAAAATFPVFGVGGLAVFRFMVERYTFTKIDEPSGTAGKTNEQWERIALFPEPGLNELLTEIESEPEMGPSVPAGFRGQSDSALILPLIENHSEPEMGPSVLIEEGDRNSGTTVLGAAVQLATGLFMESNHPEDIKWKVNKYEAQIIRLSPLISTIKSGIANKNLFQSLTESWGLIEQNVNLQEAFSRIIDYKIESDPAKRFSQDNLGQVRGLYNQFLSKIRELINSAVSDKGLDQLCHIIFTGISLETESIETLKFFEAEGRKISADQSNGDEETQTFSQRILELYNLISIVPDASKTPLFKKYCNSVRGTLNWGFNPYQQSNPIHVIYEFLTGVKAVKSIGMGSPTIEDKSCQASLAPEFLGFIRHCKEIGKTHLFISNQNTIPKYLGDETNRSNLILEAQNRSDLKGALYCVALSKNSDFYYQKSAYKNLCNAKSFKDEFYSQIMMKEKSISGCYIPESIKNNEGFDKTIEDMMTSIHDTLFKGKDNLDVEERKIFIEIFYDMLTKFLIHSLDVDSFNISCKDAIDRGAGSNAQLYAHSAILAQPEGKLDFEALQKIAILMMVRALFVRKREPIKERVIRMAETVEFMLQNSNKISDLHQKIHGDVHFLPQTIDIN